MSLGWRRGTLPSWGLISQISGSEYVNRAGCVGCAEIVLLPQRTEIVEAVVRLGCETTDEDLLYNSVEDRHTHSNTHHREQVAFCQEGPRTERFGKVM